MLAHQSLILLMMINPEIFTINIRIIAINLLLLIFTALSGFLKLKCLSESSDTFSSNVPSFPVAFKV